MTLTKEQLRKAIFGKLKGLRRKLHAHSVPCTYSCSVLSHDNGGTGFTITYRVTDDGATLVPQIAVRTAEGTQTFDHLTFDQGLARLKELFKVQGDTHRPDTGNSQEAGTNGQPSDNNSNTQDGNGYVVAPENQTPFSQEGDAK